MTRVAFLAPRGSTLAAGPQGGSSVVLMEDRALLQREGFETRLFAQHVDPEVPAQTIRIHLSLPLIASLDYCGRFVHNNPRGALLAYNEPTVALLAPSRTVVRFDWLTPLPRYWRTGLALSRFRRAIYLFPSEAFRRLWLTLHPKIPPSRTRVIPNGVDTQMFRPLPSGGSRPRRVGFVGQWIPEKGLGVLLDAWEEVHRLTPDVELWLAGGPDLWRRTDGRSGPTWLVERVKAGHHMGVRSRGILPRQDMPAFWAQVDLACVPSTLPEPFGLVALEAMACGVPVVATGVGGLPEVVDGCGVTVLPGDPRTLARTIVTLLSAPQELERLSRKSRERAGAFAHTFRVARLTSLLHELDRDAPGGRPRPG